MSKLLFAFLFSIILLSSIVSASVIISEIMYSPVDEAGGSTNEWIEIYNPDNSTIDLNGWNFSEMSKGIEKFHLISNATIPAKGYLILARNDTKFKSYFDTDCSVIKVSFGSGLNNDGDTISLLNSNNDLIDSASYDGTLANKDNNSLQFVEKWCEGAPTPGKANKCYEAPVPEPEEIADDETDNETILENDSQDNETLENETLDDEPEIEEKIITTNNASAAKKVAVSTGNKSEPGPVKVIYQSKNERMKDAAIYLLGGLVIALFLYILKSNKS